MRKPLGMLLLVLSTNSWATTETPGTLEKIKAKTRAIEQAIHQRSMSTADKQMGLLEERIRDTQSKLKAHNARVQFAEERIASLEKQQQQHQRLLAQQLRLEARAPAKEGLKLVFSANDLAQMQRLLRDYQTVRQAQAKQLNEISTNLQSQAQARTALLEDRAALQQLESELLRQQTALRKQRDHAPNALS